MKSTIPVLCLMLISTTACGMSKPKSSWVSCTTNAWGDRVCEYGETPYKRIQEYQTLWDLRCNREAVVGPDLVSIEVGNVVPATVWHVAPFVLADGRLVSELVPQWSQEGVIPIVLRDGEPRPTTFPDGSPFETLESEPAFQVLVLARCD